MRKNYLWRIRAPNWYSYPKFCMLLNKLQICKKRGLLWTYEAIILHQWVIPEDTNEYNNIL